MENKLEQIAEDIEEIKTELREIMFCLRGDPSSPQPNGLVYRVDKNTKFRETLKKILYIVAVPTMTVFGKFLFDLIKLLIERR